LGEREADFTRSWTAAGGGDPATQERLRFMGIEFLYRAGLVRGWRQDRDHRAMVGDQPALEFLNGDRDDVGKRNAYERALHERLSVVISVTVDQDNPEVWTLLR
jgi:hypothetical protein